jgi:hypothetical protein
LHFHQTTGLSKNHLPRQNDAIGRGDLTRIRVNRTGRRDLSIASYASGEIHLIDTQSPVNSLVPKKNVRVGSNDGLRV